MNVLTVAVFLFSSDQWREFSTIASEKCGLPNTTISNSSLSVSEFSARVAQ
ncbi:MAG: hypothetical protein U0X92_06905 [Anaerolineales bacterium]